jgi:hypothetical protein
LSSSHHNRAICSCPLPPIISRSVKNTIVVSFDVGDRHEGRPTLANTMATSCDMGNIDRHAKPFGDLSVAQSTGKLS